MKDVKKKYHREYALNYLVAEMLAISAVVFNMLLTKWIIRDFWHVYFNAVASFLQGDFDKFNRDAAYLFPIQAKCNYTEFGPSGSSQLVDALCILPQNVILDKIFVFLYIWYILMLVSSMLNLIYLLVMFLFGMLRIYSVGHMLERTVTIRECKEISGNGDYGLWFTLRIFHRNLVPNQFQNLCKELHLLTKSEFQIQKTPLNFDDDEKY